MDLGDLDCPGTIAVQQFPLEGETVIRTNLKILAVAALSVWVIDAGHADPMAPLTTFTAGTQAKASEVNGNFSAVSAAVNANDARITTLESSVTPAGNIVLVPSTPTAGNILKGTVPFVHNFGTSNTFIGENAGNFTMTGSFNTASGFQALQANTTGSFNTANGVNALLGNTEGAGNTASGTGALQSNTFGSNNTANGASALQNSTVGESNTASGTGALFRNTTGNNNAAFGTFALGSNTTGSVNIAIGNSAGFNLTTGDNNIDIGNFGVTAEASTIRIGTDGSQTRTFVAGIRGVTTGTIQAQAARIAELEKQSERMAGLLERMEEARTIAAAGR